MDEALARPLDAKIAIQYAKVDFDGLLANIKAGDWSTFNGKKWDPPTALRCLRCRTEYHILDDGGT